MTTDIKKLSKVIPVTRRQLLVKGAMASGGLALGLALPGCSTSKSKMTESGSWQANAWLEIDTAGKVTFTLDRVEMGQGTYTGLTTLIAEELDQAPDSIEVVFASAAQVYRNKDYGLQITGGSNSISSSWLPMRQAAASARAMVLEAAADVFQTNTSQLALADGKVSVDGTQKMIAIGELVGLAAKKDIPDEPVLKASSDFKYIGKHSKRLDSLAKVKGEAGFGIDAVVDGMAYAVVIHAPAIGARLTSHDGSVLSGRKGFIAVSEIDSGLAVVATSYWSARKFANEIKAEWDLPEKPITSLDTFELYRETAYSDSGYSVRSEGDIDEGFNDASAQTVEIEFELPFLAHATMEPMNCVAHVQENRADIWASTQGPDIAQVVVAKATHLDLDQVFVHSQFIGGGFGRRLNQDFIGEAAEISKNVGIPVKLVWSREDDMRNDFYRPSSLHRMRAAIDESGSVSAWDHHIIAPGVMDYYVWDAAPAMFPFAPKFMYPMLGKVGLVTAGTPMTPADTSAYEGANDLEYAFGAQEVRYSKADIGVPVGYWRAVGHSHNGFTTEAFIDACADAAGKDSLEFRLALLKDNPRMAGVLQLAAEKGGWNTPPAKDIYRGIAAHKSFGSYVAELVELSVESGQIKVHKVVCAIDCGTLVNPDIVTMQMESCVVFGLTAALYGEITFENGLATQSNFHDYQMVRNNECPEIDVHIVESTESPTGVGEPGLPPLAAAMASAIHKATGERQTRLPFKLA